MNQFSRPPAIRVSISYSVKSNFHPLNHLYHPESDLESESESGVVDRGGVGVGAGVGDFLYPELESESESDLLSSDSDTLLLTAV